jgi:DNA-binding NarL/FixJ family response regulator
MAPIKIIIADNLLMFRKGLRLLLEHESSIEIVGEAANGVQLLYLVKEYEPDLVITDTEMPEMGGAEATKKLKAAYPQLGIIALSMFQEDRLLVEMINAGAKGYLLKSSSKEELLAAIKAVKGGAIIFAMSALCS